MLPPFFGQFPNVANVTRASFSPWVLRMKDRRQERCLGVSSHPEAPSELILSSLMRNECEFFHFDSVEDVCLSLVSVVSSFVVASCDSARCHENICGRKVVSIVMLMFRFTTSFLLSRIFLP